MGNNSILRQDEIDAIVEIFNIGVGKAANSLNKILSYTIELNVPTIDILYSYVGSGQLGNLPGLDKIKDVSLVKMNFSASAFKR